jgi:caffeoyl-CoA O-methyltransferase
VAREGLGNVEGVTPKSFLLSQQVHDYLLAHGAAPDPVLARLTAETMALGDVAVMQSAPEQLALMTLLTRALGVRRAIEVGTFTGSSALAVARGLPDDGRILCLDVSEEWTAIARRHWEAAGVGHKVELRIGPAVDSLRALPPEPAFELAFIDADKPAYPVYYEEVLVRLRPNGVMLLDNTLQGGRVADASVDDERTRIMRDFNDLVAGDERVESVLLPVADGLTMVRKRG